MASLEDNALTLLASVENCNMNTTAAQLLLTVPDGKSCIVSHVVCKAPSISLTTASWAYGWNGATFNDVITGATHTELSAVNLYVVLIAKAGAEIGEEGDSLYFKCSIAQGAAATLKMDVFGYLYMP